MIFQPMDIQRFTMSGHKELDEQQRGFIEAGNRYLRAYNANNYHAFAEPAVVYLSDYTKRHFVTQEAFMELHNYPGIGKHVAHHNEYVREVAKSFKLLLQFKAQQNPEIMKVLSTNIAMLVSDWFEFHLLQADKRLNEFIKYEVRGVLR